MVVALEIGGGHGQAPVLADDRGTDLLAEPEVIAPATGCRDHEQRVTGFERIRVVLLEQFSALCESAGRHDNGVRADLDVVRHDTDDPTVLDEQTLHPGGKDRLHPVGTAGPVERLHQSVPLVLRHVATPDILHSGLAQPRHVSIRRHPRRDLHTEFEEPLEGRAGVLADARTRPGLRIQWLRSM